MSKNENNYRHAQFGRTTRSGPLGPCVKYLLVTLGLASVIGSFHRQGLGLLFASLRSAVRKTLYHMTRTAPRALSLQNY